MPLSTGHLRRSPIQIVFGLLVVWLVLLVVAVAFPGSVTAQESREENRGLHDTAGVFDEDERASIEAAIDDVERLGAPTVVYLRLLHTEEDRAVRDGQRLMEDWDLESAPGARDGIVLFFNLEPDDPNRGEFGIVAGEAHFDEGALPQERIDRIRDEMIEYLRNDQMAAAIILGLQRTAEYQEAGPPVPTPFERVMGQLAGGVFSPLNIVAVILAGVLGMMGRRNWDRRPRADAVQPQATIHAPGDLHPAHAGALVTGKVDKDQVEATMLHLGNRGNLTFEPEGSDKTAVRLLKPYPGADVPEFEARLLESLRNQSFDNLISHRELQESQSGWYHVMSLLRRDLESRGWFDPRSSERRRPVYLGGGVALIAATAAFFASIAGQQEHGLIGAAVLGVTGLGLLILGANFCDTTSEGERQALAWRAYRDGLKRISREQYGELDLDEAFPYLVAMSMATDFHNHIKGASESGYTPAWVDSTSYSGTNWFPHWVSFHHVFSPPSSSGSGSSAGGAASGSGGSGGRF